MSEHPAIEVSGMAKTFVLHHQGGQRLPVFGSVDLSVWPGECVALGGRSGVGKSTLLRAIYGNYRVEGGCILVRTADGPCDVASAGPRTILALRAATLGYVSQFLRVIPRVPAIDIVAEPLLAQACPEDDARRRAGALLARLNLPERLWSLPPATFSGGEQQRVNIAHGFVRRFPVLLIDEPTASLDADNRAVVIALIREARDAGSAIVGIFHDREVREAVATRTVDVGAFSLAA